MTSTLTKIVGMTFVEITVPTPVHYTIPVLPDSKLTSLKIPTSIIPQWSRGAFKPIKKDVYVTRPDGNLQVPLNEDFILYPIKDNPLVVGDDSGWVKLPKNVYDQYFNKE